MFGRSLACSLAIATTAFSMLLGMGTARADGGVVSNPVKLTIPAIGVNAGIQDVGLADDGSMGSPVGYDDVAFYTLGSSPGEQGYASFTGHISSIYFPGVFYNIDELSKGNTIHVFGDDGTELVFIVQEVGRYPANSFPMNKVFNGTHEAGLALITCGGDWDARAHLFADRILVLATLSSDS